jgi:hypothetical protein
MSENDEQELQRLCEMLRVVHEGLVEESPLREAVRKAGFGLSLAFIGGQRGRIEELAARVGKPLGEEQREELRRMGIEAEGE